MGPPGNGTPTAMRQGLRTGRAARGKAAGTRAVSLRPRGTQGGVTGMGREASAQAVQCEAVCGEAHTQPGRTRPHMRTHASAQRRFRNNQLPTRTAVTLQRPLGPRKGGQGTALCSLNDHDIHLFTNHLHKKRTKLEQIIRELGDKETVMQPRGRAGGTGWLAPLGHLLGPQAGKGLHPPRHRL